LRARSASSGDIISPGSATSGGVGSLFADSATSSASSAGLSPWFFRENSLIDDVLSEGFPDFLAADTQELSFEALASDGLVPSDFLEDLASLDFVAAVVGSDDRESELVLAAGFLVGDLALTIA
jgi:hypothetical protein